jgi:glycosyltransferase involved in cell wall biosynthesis
LSAPPPPCAVQAFGPQPSAPPALSVLAPVYRWDATALIKGLAQAPSPAAAAVELILLDDGSDDPDLSAALATALSDAPFPARLLTWRTNRGRSASRNRLIEAAHAPYVLFLDADMAPADPDFLPRWLALIEAEAPAAAFGGFTVPPVADADPTALHQIMSVRSDCRSARERAVDPAQFTASSNLLVRKSLLPLAPFDEGFRGWGWEDVDWALRVQALGPIRHLDNPALHLGLDTVDTLLRKYAEAGPNYARLAAKHPRAVRRFKSWKAAQMLRFAPGHKRLRPALAAIAKGSVRWAPLPARYAALKLYRTSVYAEHLSALR